MNLTDHHPDWYQPNGLATQVQWIIDQAFEDMVNIDCTIGELITFSDEDDLDIGDLITSFGNLQLFHAQIELFFEDYIIHRQTMETPAEEGYRAWIGLAYQGKYLYQLEFNHDEGPPIQDIELGRELRKLADHLHEGP